MMFYKILISVLVTCSQSVAFALVDYSEEVSSQTINESKRPAARPAVRQNSIISTNSKSAVRSPVKGDNIFAIEGGYHSSSVKSSQGDGKITFFRSSLHFQSAYDLFLDATHFYAQSDSKVLEGDGKNHSGNPTVKLGLNWLKMGERSTEASVDIYGGAMIKGNSLYASSRTDKIAGIETSKRFYQFAVGLGYEGRLTGTPSKHDEVAIGNISILSAGLGWVATPDIRFLVEGKTITISEYKDESRESRLDHRASYSYVSPQVQLGISSIVELTLGGAFQTNGKGIDDSLIKANLWDFQALYGNSVFTGLNISI